MKPVIARLSAVCLILILLAAFFSGCGTKEPENTQPAVPQTEAPAEPETMEAAEAARTMEEKAMEAFRALLEANPAISFQEEEILSDRSFGYEENMAKFGMHYDFFTIVDLDRDGIPELIANTIINHAWTPVSIFRYQEEENELQLLADPLFPEAHGTFEQMSTAGGMYRLYLCGKGHVHSLWNGDTPIGFQTENTACVLRSGSLEIVQCEVGSGGKLPFGVLSLNDIMQVNDEETRTSVFLK